MKEAVIFDMDGVLVDSQPFHFDVDWIVLQKNGVTVEKEVTHRYAGMSNGNRWAKYKADYNIDKNVEDIIATHVSTIFEMLESADLCAIDGIKELLEKLKSERLKMSVASSSSYDFIYKMLDKIGIRDYFDLILSGEDMKNSKPAPDIFIESAKRLGFDAEDCVIIEDSENGVLAAKAAGIFCVGYVNLNSGEQNLSKADIKITDFHQLINNNAWLTTNSK